MSKKQLKQINGDIIDPYYGIPYDPVNNPKQVHPESEREEFRFRKWYELVDNFDPNEPGPPWDKDFSQDLIEDIRDGFVNNYWRQYYIDKHTLTDKEMYEKYPDLTKEWIPDEECIQYKKDLVYTLEQGTVYLDVGGYHPQGDIVDGTPITELQGSDLKINHPPDTVKKMLVTLRSDQAPQGENAPQQDFVTVDPHVWVWCGDINDWLSINIRRVHHMWHTGFYKWNAEQHWLIEKLSRWNAELIYKKDPDAKNQPKSINDPNLVIVNVTIPKDLEQDVVPHERRWDPEAIVAFWDIDNDCRLELPIKAIYDLNIDERHTALPDPREDENHPEHEQWKLEQQ